MIVDIVIILIVLFFVLIGKKRGFALSLLSTCSIILSIVISLFLYQPVETYLRENTELKEQISNAIISSMNNEDKSGQESTNENQQGESEEKSKENQNENIIEESQTKSQEKNNNQENGFFNSLINNYVNLGKEKAEETKNQVVQQTAENITENILKVLSFVIVYILVTLILLILKFALKIFTKLPVINQIDKIGGIVLGFAEGVIIVYIIIAIISIVVPEKKDGNISQRIDESYIGRYVYNNNVIKNKILK